MLILNDVYYKMYHFPMKFSFQMKFGEKIAILGPSGSGKTTLLHLISGFLFPNSGEILLNKCNYTNVHPSKRPISMLFQKRNIFYHLNVFQNIALALNTKLKINIEQKKIIEDIANKVKLKEYLYCFPDNLSGGQCQRIALARCLIQNQSFLLLDEPLSFLDQNLCNKVINLINKNCVKKKITLLVVLHNIEDARKICKRMIFLSKGKIIWDGLINIFIKEKIIQKIKF